MSSVKEFEVKKKQIDIERNSKTMTTKVDIQMASAEIFGDVKRGLSGYEQNVSQFINNPSYAFPPFNSALPSYIHQVRRLNVAFNNYKGYIEGFRTQGGDVAEGYIQKVDDLFSQIVQYASEMEGERSRFNMSVEQYRCEKDEEMAQLKNKITFLEEKYDNALKNSFDEKAYITKLMYDLMQRKGWSLDDFKAIYSKSSTDKFNVLRVALSVRMVKIVEEEFFKRNYNPKLDEEVKDEGEVTEPSTSD